MYFLLITLLTCKADLKLKTSTDLKFTVVMHRAMKIVFVQ